jgi:uncharacterized protein with HEPN domain
MAATLNERLVHILEAIADIRSLMSGKRSSSLATERVTRAAFERFVEIISEASRHIPPETRAEFPQIPWVDVANIGNRIRHGYDSVDERILWDIYAHDIDALEEAAIAICKTLPI